MQLLLLQSPLYADADADAIANICIITSSNYKRAVLLAVEDVANVLQ